MGRQAVKNGRYPGVGLYEGEEVRSRLEVEQNRYDEARARYRRLASRVARYEKSIEEAWLARAEKEACERFLEDYGDPGLWEGHRKTLDVRYPHRASGLGRLVELLVEGGHDLDGLTVAEALELDRENGIDVGSEKYRYFGDHRGYEVPEHVIEMVLVGEKGE